MKLRHQCSLNSSLFKRISMGVQYTVDSEFKDQKSKIKGVLTLVRLRI